MSKLNKHRLLMYKLAVTYTNNRPKNKIHAKFQLDNIEYPWITDQSNDDEKNSVQKFDLLQLITQFCIKQEAQGTILDSKNKIAYKYRSHTKSDRTLLVRIDRGEYGTVRDVDNIKSKKTTQKLGPEHAVYEPFYLKLYLPNNHSEGLLFSINRGLLNVKTHFFKELKLYFNSICKNYTLSGDLFTSPEAYKEWMNSELLSITASIAIDETHDLADTYNEFPSITENSSYKREVTIKPQDNFKLSQFFNLKKLKTKGKGITLSSTYQQEFKNYDEVKANTSMGGIQKKFVLKKDDYNLESSFSIYLTNLEYSPDGHPIDSSIHTESDKIFRTHISLLS